MTSGDWQNAAEELRRRAPRHILFLCVANSARSQMRVHWGLPDPARASGDERARLDAFRQIRDELRRRLAVVFET